MKTFKLFNTYTRKQVHDVFEPSKKFKPSRGEWGLRGIVKVSSKDSFAFFVTLGHKEGKHKFKENIEENGVLNWQSQPKQKLHHKRIKKLIDHDHSKNKIHLFLRTRKNKPKSRETEPYLYLGELAYLSHDKTTEEPVHFKWQLLDWDEKRFKSVVLLAPFIVKHGSTNNECTMVITNPPSSTNRTAVHLRERFKPRKLDFEAINKNNKSLGTEGELYVLEYEISNLIKNRRGDLAKQVRHVSQEDGDGAGYDILSFQQDGDPKYIEVKTTKGSLNTSYYLEVNEVAFSRKEENNYYLYRVYDFDPIFKSGKCFIIKGNLESNHQLKAVRYSALPKEV